MNLKELYSLRAFSFVLIFILSSSFTIHNHIQILKKIKKEISKSFSIDDFLLIPVIIENEPDLTVDFSKDRFFKIISKDLLLGYAYVGTAPSKIETFEYLVLFNNEFIIKKSKVLIYREDWGSEIGSTRWLRQFNNKSIQDKFIYRENISAISGATISVKSMTNAINQLLSSLNLLIDKKIL
ncbi:MAG: FMN-binding protein [Flavobacteriaceae bacterium]|jgi:Na+-translocating ferredoxin:NAD+ oxidoreductase RnfG subunit|nr:FMN-binding protein [Flavobacteriaceae bacterium]MBT4415936.1 FMN-binding protein [Flavobacteriaceae bacterium]